MNGASQPGLYQGGGDETTMNKIVIEDIGCYNNKNGIKKNNWLFLLRRTIILTIQIYRENERKLKIKE